MHPHPDKGLKPLRSIRRDRLLDGFRHIEPDLRTDGYVSINSFWKPATGEKSALRYLNALYADCDSYRLSYGEAVGKAIDAQEEGILPRTSAIVRSGRGIWLLWLLHRKDDRSLPEQAFENLQSQYGRINVAINSRLAERYPELEPDRGAVDAARLTRLEGSFHTVAGCRVTYWWQTNERGISPSYTLDEFADFFGIAPSPKRRRRFRKNEPADVKKREAWLALQKKTRRDLKALEEHRGGMRKGTRYMAALVRATVLARLGFAETAIQIEISNYGARCKPSLSDHRQRKAIKGAARNILYGARRLGEVLQVTPDEVAKLELSTMDPRAVLQRERPTPRKSAATKRRKAIGEIAERDPERFGWKNGKAFGVREMHRRLESQGITAGVETVRRDLRFLSGE